MSEPKTLAVSATISTQMPELCHFELGSAEMVELTAQLSQTQMAELMTSAEMDEVTAQEVGDG